MKNKVSEWVAWILIYFGGAGKYLGIISFFLLLATFKATYNLPFSAWWFIPTGFAAILIVGWLDYKHVQPHQIKIGNNINNMQHSIDQLHEKLEAEHAVNVQLQAALELVRAELHTMNDHHQMMEKIEVERFRRNINDHGTITAGYWNR